MKNIVRKIINFDGCETTRGDRYKLIADVTALALQILDNKGIYESEKLNNVNVKTAYTDNGFFDGEKIVFSDYAFNGDDEELLDGLDTLSHEVCHFAQGCKKENPYLGGRNLVYSSDYFNCLLYKILELKRPDLLELVELGGIDYVVSLDPDLSVMSTYFKSFYKLQSHEKEAYNFGLEFIEKILEVAEQIDLNISERLKLNLYKKQFEKMAEDQRWRTHNMEDLRRDRRMVEDVKVLTRKVRDNFLQEHPDFFSDLATLSSNKYRFKYVKFGLVEPIDILWKSLDIDYDDEIAHKLFNALYASQIKNKEFYITALPVYTDMIMTEDEIIKFKEMLEIIRCEIFPTTYENMMENKETIARDKKLYSPQNDFCQ